MSPSRSRLETSIEPRITSQAGTPACPSSNTSACGPNARGSPPKRRATARCAGSNTGKICAHRCPRIEEDGVAFESIAAIYGDAARCELMPVNAVSSGTCAAGEPGGAGHGHQRAAGELTRWRSKLRRPGKASFMLFESLAPLVVSGHRHGLQTLQRDRTATAQAAALRAGAVRSQSARYAWDLRQARLRCPLASASHLRAFLKLTGLKAAPSKRA